MARIIVTPLPAPLVEDQTELVQLEIVVREDDFRGVFDQLEVWRVRSAGQFEELTAETWRPARLPIPFPSVLPDGLDGPSLAVAGRSLLLRVNNHDIAVALAGQNLRQVASEVQAASGTHLLCSPGAGGVLRMETTSSGNTARLEIVEGDAAALLFPHGQLVAHGKEARVALRAREERYLFSDVYGSKEYAYRTRFRNSLTGAVSDFSDEFYAAGSAPTRCSDDTVIGYVELVDAEGHPLPSREVYVEPRTTARKKGACVAVGPLVRKTDHSGRVEFRLVRGIKVSVAIQGASIVRNVSVPTDAAVSFFDLLSGDDM